MTSSSRHDRFLALREQARALLAESSADIAGQPPELRAVVEEMQVLQTELEIQAEELRIAQNETEDARRHYFSLFDEAPLAFLLLDGTEMVVELNQRGLELLGLVRRPARPLPFSSYLAPESREVWDAALLSLGQGQRTLEIGMRRARSGAFTAQCKLSRWTTRNGSRGYLVGLVDTTALRDAERGRAALAEKFEALFDSSRDGILVVDAETRRIVDINPSLSVLLRSAKRQLVGLDRDEVMWPERAAVDGLKLATQLRARSSMPAEIVLRCADGTRVSADVVVSSMETGGRMHHVLFVRDASARIELEREKARVAEVLVRGQRQSAIGQLAAGVAHDMNNTLAVLSGAIAELETAGLPPDKLAVVEEIAGVMRRGAELTGSLLALGRSEPLDKKVFDLGALLRESTRLLGRILPKSITMELTVEPTPVLVDGDASQWSRVVMNLAVNARDAMPQGGAIRIVCVSNGASAHLTFSDNGVGMTEEVRRHAFEPFFTTKGQAEGTGLGLANVHAVAEAHGANVDIESAVGRGTSLRFVMPLASRTDIAPAVATLAPSGSLRGRVLIVDDDDAVRRSTCRIVRQWGGDVEEADSGPTALEQIGRAGPPALVICDLSMPGMNGDELAAQIRESWPAVRVVVISGYVPPLVHERLARLGIDVVLKPFTKEALRAALGALP